MQTIPQSLSKEHLYGKQSMQFHQALSTAGNCFSSNKLKLSEEKTNMFTFSLFQLTDNTTKSVKFLGLYLDEQLNHHTEHLSKKINSGTYAVRKIKTLTNNQDSILWPSS